MKHWVSRVGDVLDIPSEAFFNEIEEVCRRYGVSISHEDSEGAFVINELDEEDIAWLRGATFTQAAVEVISNKV